MATASPSALECPVCHEGFSEPKILPCTHLVCRKCVLSWIEKGGIQNGCPLCRAPILSRSFKGQGDLASEVDALPTDLATATVVDSQKILSSDHVCSCSGEASLFCLQCSIKLCSNCGKSHAKIPTTRSHVTEKLSDLSAEQLATHHQIFCVHHSDKPAELFCSKHQELICLLCASSTHHSCPEFKGIGDVATVKREDLRSLVQRLGDKETAVTAKVIQLDTESSDAKAQFKAMRDEVKTTYDDLQMSLEARRQKLNAELQEREDAYLAERKSTRLDLENIQAALTANRNTAERLVVSAPDISLLGMLGKLKARLEALESQALPDDPTSTPGRLLIDADTVDRTKKAMGTIGVLTDSTTEQVDKADIRCLWCGHSGSVKPGLEGPEFAAIIKVGDRVRRGRNWNWGPQDGSPPGAGTVTAVPRDLKTVSVEVKWDCGEVYAYRMGEGNCYDLKFVGRD